MPSVFGRCGFASAVSVTSITLVFSDEGWFKSSYSYTMLIPASTEFPYRAFILFGLSLLAICSMAGIVQAGQLWDSIKNEDKVGDVRYTGLS